MTKFLVRKKEFLNTYQNIKLGLHSFNKYKFWFPVYPSSILARIIADITSDGYLGNGILQFISKDQKEVIKFRQRINMLFNFKGKIRRSPSNQSVWECIVINRPMFRILRLCGAPVGNKVLKRFNIPRWIFLGDNKIKINYIKGLYDGEGSIVCDLKKNKRIRIKLKFHKEESIIDNLEEYLDEIRSVLETFKIRTTRPYNTGKSVRKDGKVTFGREFEIQGTRCNLSSVLNFQKHINFSSKRKAKILNNSIKYLTSIALVS